MKAAPGFAGFLLCRHRPYCCAHTVIWCLIMHAELIFFLFFPRHFKSNIFKSYITGYIAPEIKRYMSAHLSSIKITSMIYYVLLWVVLQWLLPCMIDKVHWANLNTRPSVPASLPVLTLKGCRLHGVIDNKVLLWHYLSCLVQVEEVSLPCDSPVWEWRRDTTTCAK